MKTIQFTAVEIRALKALLWENPCMSSCAFSEMQNKDNVDCDECPFTKAVHSIEYKLN